jgi:hypothetical protein
MPLLFLLNAIAAGRAISLAQKRGDTLSNRGHPEAAN